MEALDRKLLGKRLELSSSRTGGSKRRRKTSGGAEKALKDRISGLPNKLLHHILSFLPTKHAATTSLLSKKWQYLWALTPVLDFHDSRDMRDDCDCDEDPNSVFLSFINRSLILNRSPKIETFRVHLKYDKAFASHVDAWLSVATRKNVEDLDLNFSPSWVRSIYYRKSCDEDEDEEDDDDNNDEDDDYEDDDYSDYYYLPMNMLSNNSSLATLKLKKCAINHGGKIYWESLRVLSLSHVYLNNDVLSRMLPGCPSLELLELLKCWNYGYLDIKSKRMRKLVIIERKKSTKDPIVATKISAPHLQSLDISGVLLGYSVINLSSLVDAELNFEQCSSEFSIYGSSSSDLDKNPDKYTKILVELLDNIRHVKYLTLRGWCLEVLTMLEDDALPCTPTSLVCLRLETSLRKKEVPGIIRLLGHSPLIETLIINSTDFSLNALRLETEFLKYYDHGGEKSWLLQKSSFTLALKNLKTVRIVDFQAMKNEVKFILFLLKNASMLEQMILHPPSITEVSLEESVEVTQMLLSYPRCSPKAVVLFS